MNLIDFDKLGNDYFMEHLDKEALKNLSEEEKHEEIEWLSIESYEKFVQIPNDSLGGESPKEYFEKFSNEELMDMYVDYFNQYGSIPEILNETIMLREDGCEEALFEIVQDEDREKALRMNSIDLLSDNRSKKPLKYYVLLQTKRKIKDDLADKAFEALMELDTKAVKAEMLNVFEDSNNAGRDIMLELLAKPKCSDMVFQHALKSFNNALVHREIYAKFLGEIEDKRALESLLKAANDPNTDYLDYMEIRVAIERLGGKCPKRDFSQDFYYKHTH